jgi:hypothetical protein
MSHRLLVEMKTDARWLWHAADDYHGTTTGDFTTSPEKLTMGYIKNNIENGQWTKVSVLPKAVLSASLNCKM